MAAAAELNLDSNVEDIAKEIQELGKNLKDVGLTGERITGIFSALGTAGVESFTKTSDSSSEAAKVIVESMASAAGAMEGGPYAMAAAGITTLIIGGVKAWNEHEAAAKKAADAEFAATVHAHAGVDQLITRINDATTAIHVMQAAEKEGVSTAVAANRIAADGAQMRLDAAQKDADAQKTWLAGVNEEIKKNDELITTFSKVGMSTEGLYKTKNDLLDKIKEKMDPIQQRIQDAKFQLQALGDENLEGQIAKRGAQDKAKTDSSKELANALRAQIAEQTRANEIERDSLALGDTAVARALAVEAADEKEAKGKHGLALELINLKIQHDKYELARAQAAEKPLITGEEETAKDPSDPEADKQKKRDSDLAALNARTDQMVLDRKKAIAKEQDDIAKASYDKQQQYIQQYANFFVSGSEKIAGELGKELRLMQDRTNAHRDFGQVVRQIGEEEAAGALKAAEAELMHIAMVNGAKAIQEIGLGIADSAIATASLGADVAHDASAAMHFAAAAQLGGQAAAAGAGGIAAGAAAGYLSADASASKGSSTGAGTAPSGGGATDSRGSTYGQSGSALSQPVTIVMPSSGLFVTPAGIAQGIQQGMQLALRLQ